MMLSNYFQWQVICLDVSLMICCNVDYSFFGDVVDFFGFSAMGIATMFLGAVS